MLIRASVGTLAVLKLIKLRMLDVPRTAYLLQYSEGGCEASCSFCPQSKFSQSNKELVSRIPWPRVNLERLARELRRREGYFLRICLQSVLKRGFEEELVEVLRRFRELGINLPISISTTPVPTETLDLFKRLNVDRIGIGLDAASPSVLARVKKPYNWETYWRFIRSSVKKFGRGKVSVHLIFGLGESEREFAKTMQDIYEEGAEIALFAFTPVPGTKMARQRGPDVGRYRVVQVLRHLLSRGHRLEDVADFEGDEVRIRRGVMDASELEKAFLTSGCPGCNRPFYNERPSLIYNYPSTRLLRRDIKRIKRDVAPLLKSD